MIQLSVLAFAYVISLFYRAVVSVIAPELSADLSLDESDLGAVSSAFFIAFAAAQIPVGMALDRLGPRITVSAFMSLTIAGALTFVLSTGFWTATGGMALIGAGCAPVFTGSMVVIARSYPPARFGFMTAMMIAVGGLGDLLSTAPLAVLSEIMGWRGAIAVALGLTVAAAFACYVFIAREDHADDHKHETLSQLFIGMLGVATIRGLWPILPLSFLGYAVMMTVRGLWSGPYLSDIFDLGPSDRGFVLLLMSGAMGAGIFGYGFADRWIGRPKRITAVGSFAVVAATGALALLPPATWQQAAVLLCVIGLFGGTYPILMAHGRSFIPVHMTGRGVAFLTLVNFLGVGVVQAASGWVMESALRQEQGSAQAYITVFTWLAVILGLALVAYLFSREAHAD